MKNKGAGRPKKVAGSAPSDGWTVKTAPGLPAAIARLRDAEVAAAVAYESAVKGGDHELIARKKKDWCDLVEQLRKVESSNPTIEKETNASISIDDVEREVGKMCSAFRIKLESMARALPPRLVGQNEVAIYSTIRKEVNETLAVLATESWVVEPVGITDR